MIDAIIRILKDRKHKEDIVSSVVSGVAILSIFSILSYVCISGISVYNSIRDGREKIVS